MKKIFVILIICMLSLPVVAMGEQEAGFTPEIQEELEVIEPEGLSEINDVKQNIEDIAPLPNALHSIYKEPISKKKLAKKFIIAMLCVAGTSIFLYTALSIYNKIRDGVLTSQQSSAEGDSSLTSSTDLTEAIKTFVDKTRWN